MRNWWRFTAIGVLTAGLMLAFGSSPSMAAPRAHVYLLRGLLNIFSLGMDTLSDQLNNRGVYATVDNHADWQSLADSAAANYKAGREGPIILIGHSLGADAVMEMAAYLGRRDVPVALVVPFDGTASFPASANVARVLNLSQHYWMTRGPGFHGSLINVDLRGDPNIDHLNIDKSPRLHARVIAEVLAIVGSHRTEQRTAKPENAEPAKMGEKSSEKPSDEKAGDGVARATVKPLADSGTPVIAAPERGGKATGSDEPAAAKPANLAQ
ncbi:MAG: thioesterase domain-containing protein [Xanthobacteraceae bacterium]